MEQRVVVYVRVATAEQDTDMVLKQQYEKIKQYCDEQGYKIVAAVRYIGGGKKANHNLRKVAKTAKRNKANAVIAMRLDRFTRDIPFFLKMQKRMASRNIRLETSNEVCNVISVPQLARRFI